MRGQKLFDGTNGYHRVNVRRFHMVAAGYNAIATTTFMFPDSSTFLTTSLQASTVSYEASLPSD